jgi:hypothetical protein
MVFPPGSLFDPDDLEQPPPSTPFAFPLNPTSDQAFVGMLADLSDMPTAMDSVTHVVSLLRICGLSGDSSTSVTIHTSSANNMPLLDTGSNICVTLVDTDANICVTGLLEALVVLLLYLLFLFLWQSMALEFPLMIVALTVVYFHSHWRMARSTTRRAIFAKTL